MDPNQIPQAAISLLLANARKRWPADFNMQLHEFETQKAALIKVNAVRLSAGLPTIGADESTPQAPTMLHAIQTAADLCERIANESAGQLTYAIACNKLHLCRQLARDAAGTLRGALPSQD